MDEVKNLEGLETTGQVETSQSEDGAEKLEKKSFLKSLFSKDEKSQTETETVKPADDFDARLKAEKEKWLKELEEQRKFEALSEEEKAKAREKEKDDEIKSLRETIQRKELRAKAAEALEKEGFSTKLAGILDLSSEDNMTSSLEMVKDVFKETLQEAINDRLKSKTPEGLGDAAQRENMVRDEIAEAIRGGF